MTKADAVAQLRELVELDDIEHAHYVADDILCRLLKTIGGFEDVIEAWENVPKWYA